MARTRANLFEVAGGATSVTYATTGIAGQPSFHFRDTDHDVNAEGTDIRTKKTELGTLVTIPSRLLQLKGKDRSAAGLLIRLVRFVGKVWQ